MKRLLKDRINFFLWKLKNPLNIINGQSQSESPAVIMLYVLPIQRKCLLHVKRSLNLIKGLGRLDKVRFLAKFIENRIIFLFQSTATH